MLELATVHHRVDDSVVGVAHLDCGRRREGRGHDATANEPKDACAEDDERERYREDKNRDEGESRYRDHERRLEGALADTENRLDDNGQDRGLETEEDRCDGRHLVEAGIEEAQAENRDEAG
jgi:hypothetical protein